MSPAHPVKGFDKGGTSIKRQVFLPLLPPCKPRDAALHKPKCALHLTAPRVVT